MSGAKTYHIMSMEALTPFMPRNGPFQPFALPFYLLMSDLVSNSSLLYNARVGCSCFVLFQVAIDNGIFDGKIRCCKVGNGL